MDHAITLKEVLIVVGTIGGIWAVGAIIVSVFGDVWKH